MTIGEPDMPTPEHLVQAAARAMKAGRTGYSNGRGEPAALAALSAQYSAMTGREIGTDRFLCLPGTQTALYVALTAVCDPGCEVILADPMYATYEGLIRAAGGRAGAGGAAPRTRLPPAGGGCRGADLARDAGDPDQHAAQSHRGGPAPGRSRRPPCHRCRA